jgi:aryl-alcohol dehydrogenase-like predicted oxidoreductase
MGEGGMQYVNLGKSGLKVSNLALGAASFGTGADKSFALGYDEALALVRAALEAGINFFDTAETYTLGNSEAVLGKALKACAVHREDIVLQTKFGPGSKRFRINRSGLSRKHILNSIDESLARLQTDYVDIFSIHRLDGITPFEETLEAMHDVVKSGKARYLGASSMYAWQFERMLSIQERHGWTKFISMQNYYSLVYREEEREMIPLCRDRGIGVTPWGVLSAGLLAGTICRDGTRNTGRARGDLLKGERGAVPATHQDFDIQDNVRAVAQRRGVSMAQVAMAWVLSKPFVSACLIGPSKASQLASCVQAADIRLDPQEIAALEAGYRPVAPQTLDAMVTRQTAELLDNP